MNANEFAELNAALDAILANDAKDARKIRKENKGSAIMRAYAKTCADKADALEYVTSGDEMSYGQIEDYTRHMAFERE